VLDDLRRFTVALDKAVTLDAAERLPGFEKPVLFAWAPDDKLFPLEHARRLAAAQPDARVETIADSRAFSMIDQPDRLAGLIAEVAQRSAAGHAIR
jgi:pimeloyl-ACP methyl ester carboxylesterase